MATVFELGDQYGDDDIFDDLTGGYDDLELSSDPESSFVAEFCAGYIFRMLIEYLRETNTAGNLIVTRDTITYTQMDGLKTLVNDVIIYTHELTRFEFNSKTPIIVGIDTNDFRDKTKNIKKKYKVTLYKEPFQDDLFMEIHGQSSSGTGSIITIDSALVSLTSVDIPTYYNPSNRPNCTIAASAFSEKCSLMKDSSINRVEISGYDNGIAILGRSECGKIAKFCNFGDLPDDSGDNSDKSTGTFDFSSLHITKPTVVPKFVIQEDLPISSKSLTSITVNVATIKAISKFGNITPNGGTVKVYFERDKPVKFVCHVGTFGQLTVYLKGVKSD